MKSYWGLLVVFGIALMLGLSSIPSFAITPQYTCHGIFTVDFLLTCNQEPEIGDHIRVVIAEVRPGTFNIADPQVCHADVIDKIPAGVIVPPVIAVKFPHGENCELDPTSIGFYFFDANLPT